MAPPPDAADRWSSFRCRCRRFPPTPLRSCTAVFTDCPTMRRYDRLFLWRLNSCRLRAHPPMSLPPVAGEVTAARRTCAPPTPAALDPPGPALAGSSARLSAGCAAPGRHPLFVVLRHRRPPAPVPVRTRYAGRTRGALRRAGVPGPPAARPRLRLCLALPDHVDFAGRATAPGRHARRSSFPGSRRPAGGAGDFGRLLLRQTVHSPHRALHPGRRVPVADLGLSLIHIAAACRPQGLGSALLMPSSRHAT